MHGQARKRRAGGAGATAAGASGVCALGRFDLAGCGARTGSPGRCLKQGAEDAQQVLLVKQDAPDPPAR